MKQSVIPPCLFHISDIGIKDKLTEANSENPDETSTLFAHVCTNLPDVRIYPTLPYRPLEIRESILRL